MKPKLAGPASLPEVHGSVPTTWPNAMRRMLAFSGPAYLVSVGYMDPGNWATDLEGGARFGYQLLWVLALSNAMAILLQTLSARLGIVSGRDLAQACREAYARGVSNSLWILCEIAIAACDLAEVLGAAIGLNLLFHIPLTAGVLLTALDTILVLWLTRYGIRLVEAIILSLVLIVTGCFLVELWFAKPVFGEVFTGLVPRLNDASLYVAIGMLGATVMPHNLYLHSALVQTRRIGKSPAEKRVACRYNFIDSFIALNGALIVNGAILVLAAAVFFKNHTVVTEIQQAHQLLAPLLGTAFASALFAIALLASGQSSTLTGTYAGQIVMEGFLNLRVRPWLRRLITRSVAVIPAVITVYYSGDQGTYRLLILSQVILSMQLPFAVIPLIRFTSDRSRMGEFANRAWVNILAWGCAALIIVLNFWLAADEIVPWVQAVPWRGFVVAPAVLAVIVLLAWVTFARPRPQPIPLPHPGAAVATDLPALRYRSILVPLDHSNRDRAAVAHAAAMAHMHGAVIHVLHVEEGATSQLFGPLASTSEVSSGQQYFEDIVHSLTENGLEADLRIAHGRSPRAEIIRAARALQPDLVVMGAHGHTGLKDLIFGTTIDGVRHAVSAAVLVVADPPA
ncbi:MAG TPA: Nramp family divalent metal transporter [Bryobacteraceae bacterium]